MEGWQKRVLHRPAKTKALRGLRVRASHLPHAPRQRGGTGRRSRLKPDRATVQVRVLPLAPADVAKTAVVLTGDRTTFLARAWQATLVNASRRTGVSGKLCCPLPVHARRGRPDPRRSMRK